MLGFHVIGKILEGAIATWAHAIFNAIANALVLLIDRFGATLCRRYALILALYLALLLS